MTFILEYLTFIDIFNMIFPLHLLIKNYPKVFDYFTPF